LCRSSQGVLSKCKGRVLGGRAAASNVWAEEAGRWSRTSDRRAKKKERKKEALHVGDVT